MTYILRKRVIVMKIVNTLAAAAAFFAVATATPASAAIYTYTMDNDSVLSINTETQSANFKGADIDSSMTSAAFATFPGGALPFFTGVLSSLDGTRLIYGNQVTDNPLMADTLHPQKLIMEGKDVNLWAWWGDPIIGGDYLTKITSYSVNTTSGGGGTSVPEPGMLGLLAVGVVGLGLARRRHRKPMLAA